MPSWLAGILLLLVLTAAAVSPAFAQQLPDPDVFFDREFISRSAQGKVRVEKELPRAAAATLPASTARPIPGANQTARPLAVRQQKTPSAKGLYLPRGIKVISVGAILNALERPHLEASLGELSAILKRCRLKQGQLHLLGVLADYPLQDRSQIRNKYGVRLEGFTDSVPPQYPAVSSPAWILQTAEGQILIEAAGPLNDYFNEHCEFVKR